MRDELDGILAVAERAKARLWIVGLGIVVGIVGGVVLAMVRAPLFQSYATLFYQERIQTSVLMGREMGGQRNIGDRYREILFSRAHLAEIVSDPEINPYPKELAKEGVEAAVEEMRKGIRLEDRGHSALRLSFQHPDRKVAKRVVDGLATMLIEKDTKLRQEPAIATAEFIQREKDGAEEELRKRQRKLSEFYQKHPEFVAETSGANEGAAIRASTRRAPVRGGGDTSRAGALERQIERLRARRDGTSASPTTAAPSAEDIAAQQAFDAAEQEVRARERAVADALQKYTDKHPSVAKAREDLASAKERRATAQSRVRQTPVVEVARPPTVEERSVIERQVAELESQLSAERARGSQAATAASSVSATTEAPSWVVKLETEYAELRRAVEEQQEESTSLAEQYARARQFASQQREENGNNLSVIDPAIEPLTPATKGRQVLVGVGAFGGLLAGLVLALLFAFLDDRVFRRSDIEQNGLGEVLAEVGDGAEKGKV